MDKPRARAQLVWRLSLLAMFLALAACGSGVESGGSERETGGSGTVSLSVQVIWPQAPAGADRALAESAVTALPEAAPAGVANMKATVTVDTFTTSQTFTAAAGSGSISGVPSGAGSLTLDALDTNGSTLYSGTNNFSGTGGQTLTVTVTMAPASGVSVPAWGAPAAPTGLTATAASGQVTLTWTAASGASSYNAYWGTATGVTPKAGTRLAAVTSGYVHAGLTNAIAHFYVVTAVNSAGEGAASAQASATPTAAVTAAGATTYTIAGTITGLTAAGLVLQNNGADNLTVASGSTTFTFATKLANGASYSVTVLTQPGNLTCTVSAGSGAVSAANVTGVGIVCGVAPPAPTGLAAVSGNAQVTLSWNASSGATSYTVYASTTDGVLGSPLSAGNATTYTHTPLSNGQTHYYVVSATGALEGAKSGQVAAAAHSSGTANAWIGLASGLIAMPTARQGATNAEVNGVVYVIGGYDGTNYLSTVEAYDPVTNAWSAKTPTGSPTARFNATSAVVNGIIYVIGGSNGTGSLSVVEAYDPVANAWTTKSPTGTFTARNQSPSPGASSAVVNGIVYVSGGCCVAGLTAMEAFDPAANAGAGSWTLKPAMTTGRYSSTAAAVNGIIYVIGGFDSFGTQINAVEAFDPAGAAGAGSWTSKAVMTTARGEAAAAVVNGTVYVSGGWNGGALTTVEAYDPIANGWTPKTSMATARHALSALSVNGIAYASGGFNTTGTAFNTVEAYTPSANASPGWDQTKPAIAGNLAEFAAVEANGKIYTIGGSDLTSFPADVPTVNVFDTATNLWSAGTALPSHARSLLGGANVNGKLYAVGGSGAASSRVDMFDLSVPASGWVPQTPLSTARKNLGVASVNGIVYAIGGIDTTLNQCTRSVEAFNGTAWVAKANMPTARYSMAIAVHNGRIYAIGGTLCGLNETTVVEAYDPLTDTWSTRAPMPTSRTAMVAGTINGLIYVTSGGSVGSVLTKLESYDPVKNTWVSPLASMFNARYYAGGGAANGKLYVFGGETFAQATAVTQTEIFTP